jgi:exopolysaccharide biosynthesis polyprenyl glycosylphosphotransferase
MNLSNSVASSGPRRWLIGPNSERSLLVSTLKLLDTAQLTCVFLIAAVLTSFQPKLGSLDEFLSMRLKLTNFGLFLGLLMLWRLGFAVVGLYDPARPLLRGRLRDSFLATTFAVLTVAVCGYTADISLVSLPFLFTFAGVGYCSVLGSRLILSSAHAVVRNSATQRKVLVVGTGQRAIRYARSLEKNPEAPASVIGFCDEPWKGTSEFLALGFHHVTDPKNFRSFIRDNVVDEVVIAIPLSAFNRFECDLLGACEEHGITVRLLSNILSDLGVRATHGEESEDGVLVSLYHGVVYGRQFLAKRALDVVLSLLFIVLALPVLAIAAIAIRLESPGPVVFTQIRVGLNKRPFRMYKFRTMRVDAEEQMAAVEHLNEAGGPVFKIENDPRVTRMGRWLRATSIDELPQLFNVLKREMSLVGPRPLPLRDFAGFDDDRHRRRFSVVPGVTGLWQVSGRSSVGFEEWMELDLHYVENWSLALDLKILLSTLPAVLKRGGAH